MKSEGFSPSEHDMNLNDRTRDAIRDPENIGTIELPKAKETFFENKGKLILRPNELMPENISVIIGARSQEKGTIEWNDRVFVAVADIKREKTIRIQQGHTANAIEVSSEDAPAFDLIKNEDGKVVEDKRLTKDGAKVDACWTKDPGITLMIGSADCAAIAIAGKDKKGKDIIAIAHSGIAGSQKDLVGNVIKDMIKSGDADPNTFKVYVSPSICDRCYPILSEDANDQQVEKSISDIKKEVEFSHDDKTGSVEVSLTYASASYEKFKEEYGNKFKELFGREIHQNDLFYVAQNENGKQELHFRVDNQILISLVCNGVNIKNIGFSQVCTKNDSLPSSRGTGEVTGIFSTITISAEEHDQNFETENNAIKRVWSEKGFTNRGYDDYYRILSNMQEDSEGGIEFNGISEDEFNVMLKGGKVLDAACGQGFFVRDCLKKGYDTYGIDLALRNPVALDKVISINPESKARLIAGDATELPFTKEAFRTIINIYGAPNYIQTPQKAEALILEELRVLEKGGKIIISPSAFSEDSVYPINLLKNDKERTRTATVEQAFSKILMDLQQTGKISIKKYGYGYPSLSGADTVIIEKLSLDRET